jgi:hypothetical protein
LLAALACYICKSSDDGDSPIFFCSNGEQCGKVQHVKCIITVPKPVEDDDTEWCCDDCYTNCTNCSEPDCPLFKEQNLSKLIQCDECKRWLHYPCAGLDSAPVDMYFCPDCSANTRDDNLTEELQTAFAQDQESDFEDEADLSRPRGRRRRTSAPAASSVKPSWELSQSQRAALPPPSSFPLSHTDFNTVPLPVAWDNRGEAALGQFIDNFSQ